MAISLETEESRPDPLIQINQAAESCRRTFKWIKAGFLTNQVLLGTSIIISEMIATATGIPDWVSLPAEGGALLGMSLANRRLFRWGLSSAAEVFNKQEREVAPQLQEDGIARDSLPISIFDGMVVSEIDLKYELARRVRNTKVLLAYNGRLDEYQPYKWIKSASIPDYLKPRPEDLDEVDRWVERKKRNEVGFVAALSEKDRVTVVCSRESSDDTAHVVLVNKESSTFKSMPLTDVMALWGTTQQRTHEDLINAWQLRLTESASYQGIDTDAERQRIADFFERPVIFLSGRRVWMRPVDHYRIGVKDFEPQQYRRIIYKEKFEPRSQQQMPEVAIT